MTELKVKLHPIFDATDVAQAIDITMVFDAAEKRKGEVLLDHVLMRAVVPTMQYTANSVFLTDSNESPIALYTIDTTRNSRRQFCIAQDISAGERLTLRYQAIPRNVNELTRCGPQIAIEQEASGLSGAGMAFLLIPIMADSDLLYDIVIEWDLSSAPSATRAVCTFGEGNRISFQERLSVLLECYFAVGPLQSYPPTSPDEETSTSQSLYGMYWLSDTPFNSHDLGRKLQELVPRMADFFGDTEQLFRIFIRRNIYKCASGRGLHRGFVFSWTPICPKDPDMVQEFLFHELVHNWPRLGSTTGGPEDLIDAWFNEGIAEYYSVVLPYIFGILTEEEFIERLNWRISGYYTNPDRAVLNKDVQSQFWHPGRVNRIPYQRGFMYFVQLSYRLRMRGEKSLNDLIREMIKLRTANRPHGIGIWLSLVEQELGTIAHEDYENMSNAKVIILPIDVAKVWIPDCQWELKPVKQEEFYLGFPESNLSADPRVIEGLDLKSRAAEAGLQEGDRITLNYDFLVDADVWPRLFSIRVKRGNDETPHKITWWPRSWHNVDSYQFVSLCT